MVAGFVLAVGAQLDLKGQANWGCGGGLAVLTPSYHWGQTFLAWKNGAGRCGWLTPLKAGV